MRRSRRRLPRDPFESANLHARRLREPLTENEYAVTMVAGGHEVTLHVEGTSEEDVAETVKMWLDTTDDPAIGDGDWRTTDANFQGQRVQATFRASWVAGFVVAVKKS